MRAHPLHPLSSRACLTHFGLPASLVAIVGLALLCACNPAGSKGNPIEMTPGEARSASLDDREDWVRVTGKVVNSGFADSDSEWGYICEDKSGGTSIKSDCIICGSSVDQQALAAREGETVTAVGMLGLNGSNHTSLGLCELE